MNRRNFLALGLAAPFVPYFPLSQSKPKIRKTVLDLTAKELIEMRDLASLTSFHDIHQMYWHDFQESPGNTINEKYEALYVQIVGVSNNIQGNCIQGANFIITTPAICGIFRCATPGWNQTMDCFPSENVHYEGTLNCRWRVYTARIFQMLYPSRPKILNLGDIVLGCATYGKIEECFILPGAANLGYIKMINFEA